MPGSKKEYTIEVHPFTPSFIHTVDKCLREHLPCAMPRPDFEGAVNKKQIVFSWCLPQVGERDIK